MVEKVVIDLSEDSEMSTIDSKWWFDGRRTGVSISDVPTVIDTTANRMPVLNGRLM